MKKLTSIDAAFFKENFILLNNNQLCLDSNMEKWLGENIDMSIYNIENYSEDYSELKRVRIKTNNGIVFYIENNIIMKVNVYPFIYENSPYFKGNIFFQDKLLKVPFKSDDIEEYFPNALVERPSSKIIDRFTPRDIISCPIDKNTEIELTIGRDPRLVSIISLKKIN